MNLKENDSRGCILLILWLLAGANANAEQSFLLKLAQDLHCASSEPQAETALKKLLRLPLEPLGIPSENVNPAQHAELYAATVDILLQVLYETIQRYPKLQVTAERTALLWNYCDVINDGDLADLFAKKSSGVVKSEAIGPFPANKIGFERWGFLGNGTIQRFLPETLNTPALFPRAYQDLLHRLTVDQCFPHPDSVNVRNKAPHKQPYSGILQMTDELARGKKYPYDWRQDCQPIATAKRIVQAPSKPAVRIMPEKMLRSTIQNKVAIAEMPVETPKKIEIRSEKIISKPQPKIISTKPKPKPRKKMPVESDPFVPVDVIADRYTEPANDETPVVSPALPPSGNSNVGAALPLPLANGFGIAGNFYHRAKLTGAMSVGANVSWKPYSYFFVRGGANYNYLPDSGKFSYAWGLGYDDWHPGTFSAQINNWGPIVPGDGNALSGAAANIGYKFVANFLKPYHLNGSAAVNIPFTGNPSLSTTWVWSPVNHWFIRASVSKSLAETGGFDWSYGFGYSDWRPFTVSLTYDNWGKNPIFTSGQGNNINFTENGAITLSWSWSI